MPELPEIESLRRSLACLVRGRVVGVHVRRRDMVFPAGALPLPCGSRVRALHRRGKQLVLETERHGSLMVHLGMSGSLRLVREGECVAKDRHVHTEWAFLLPDGSRCRLLHRDPRRFGWLEIHADLDSVHQAWQTSLGPDALQLDVESIIEVMHRSSRPVKAVLLDQSVVAGIGNIYADEALFRAGIHPMRKARLLDDPAIRRLVGSIRSVLRKAVDMGGSTIRDHRTIEGGWGSYQRLHRVYGRGNLPCHRCGTLLRSTTLQQRATVFCPLCQRFR